MMDQATKEGGIWFQALNSIIFSHELVTPFSRKLLLGTIQLIQEFEGESGHF